MSNEMTADQVNSIMTVLNNAGTQAVQQYGSWFFTNAVVWLLVGAALVVTSLSLLNNLKRISEKFNDDSASFAFGVGVVCGVLGLILMGCNVTNLFAPEAYAIHQLIIDIRG